jgi:hypothetical protein
MFVSSFRKGCGHTGRDLRVNGKPDAKNGAGMLLGRWRTSGLPGAAVSKRVPELSNKKF